MKKCERYVQFVHASIIMSEYDYNNMKWNRRIPLLAINWTTTTFEKECKGMVIFGKSHFSSKTHSSVVKHVLCVQRSKFNQSSVSPAIATLVTGLRKILSICLRAQRVISSKSI